MAITSNITPQLTVNAGVRWDHYSSWLPEQGNPGTGPFATARIIPEMHGFPVYNAISPRVCQAASASVHGAMWNIGNMQTVRRGSSWKTP